MSTALLTRAEFVAYLRAQPADKFFVRGIESSCPIACALVDHHKVEWATVMLDAWGIPKQVRNAPKWVTRFLYDWDTNFGPSTAAEALRLLGEDA